MTSELQDISPHNQYQLKSSYIYHRSDKLAVPILGFDTLRMPESHSWSRYDHIKAIFSRRAVQDSEMKDDSRSDITLVPGYVSPNMRMEFVAYHILIEDRQNTPSQKKRDIPQNFNGKSSKVAT
jgi:hypothetical protein